MSPIANLPSGISHADCFANFFTDKIPKLVLRLS